MPYRRSQKRRRTRRKKRLSRRQYRLKRTIRSQMLNPNNHIFTDTWEFDHTTFNTWGYPFLDLNGWHQMQVKSSSVYYDSLVALSLYNEDLNYIVGRDACYAQLRNTGTGECIFEMVKLKPKFNLTSAHYSVYSINSGYITNLVKKLIEEEGGETGVTGSGSHESFNDYKGLRKHFKILKSKHICLEPGETLNLKCKASPYRYLSGHLLGNATTNTIPMFYRGNGYFWFIRVKGPIVHDTGNDAAVGEAGCHLDILFKRVSSYYVPSTIDSNTLMVSNYDTITTPETVSKDDVVMKTITES